MVSAKYLQFIDPVSLVTELVLQCLKLGPLLRHDALLLCNTAKHQQTNSGAIYKTKHQQTDSETIHKTKHQQTDPEAIHKTKHGQTDSGTIHKTSTD